MLQLSKLVPFLPAAFAALCPVMRIVVDDPLFLTFLSYKGSSVVAFDSMSGCVT